MHPSMEDNDECATPQRAVQAIVQQAPASCYQHNPLHSTLTLCLTTTGMQLTPSLTQTCQLPATKLDQVGTLQGLTSPVSIQEIIYLLPEAMQG
jgi:hypothetical protein